MHAGVFRGERHWFLKLNFKCIKKKKTDWWIRDQVNKQNVNARR